MDRTVVWRREDVEGHGVVRVSADSEDVHIQGFEVTASGGARFEIDLDAGWRTRTVDIESIGRDGVSRAMRLEADGSGAWMLNGQEIADVRGCVDVDLYSVPVTNTLPIRRLTLADGEEAHVAAVWIGLPELEIERLEQVYRRVGQEETGRWRYEYRPAGSDNSVWMTVDSDCIVIDYEDFATRLT